MYFRGISVSAVSTGELFCRKWLVGRQVLLSSEIPSGVWIMQDESKSICKCFSLSEDMWCFFWVVLSFLLRFFFCVEFWLDFCWECSYSDWLCVLCCHGLQVQRLFPEGQVELIYFPKGFCLPPFLPPHAMLSAICFRCKHRGLHRNRQ